MNGEVKTTFLISSFEADQGKLLGIPFEKPIELVTYEDDWNPYETLLDSNIFSPSLHPNTMIDGDMRDFSSRGLATSGFYTIGLGGRVEQVRQIKFERGRLVSFVQSILALWIVFVHYGVA